MWRDGEGGPLTILGGGPAGLAVAHYAHRAGVPFALYPAAFGHLVASKAYGVTRAAATPRVLPPGLNLVTANSRVMLRRSSCGRSCIP